MTGNRDLIVASNRGPISLVAGENGGVQTKRGAGGLVSGLRTALSDSHGLWVCSALNDREQAFARQAPDGHLREAGIDTDELDVRMLPIDSTTLHRAYNGIANSTLWFLHHLLFDTPNRPRFDSGWRKQWAAYQKYNNAFAEAVASEAAPGGTVMAQDYHLCLLPHQLRQRRPDVRIGHFTHTPWAPPEYFGILPDDVAQDVLLGLLGADHVGFHCDRWAGAFLACCAEFLPVTVDSRNRTVSLSDRTVHVGVHPLGVDTDELITRAHQPDVDERLAHLNNQVGDRLVISRVDRTELQKNIVRGLLAYREFLHRYPEWFTKVVHVAFIYPSRQDLPEYREYTAAVQRIAREIEEEFGTDDWSPLILDMSNDYPGSLAALRLADVLLINPIRDGMNLVVKEGLILSKPECAVVLSREAGAVEQLGAGSIVVNPFDISQTAEAINTALSLSPDDRRNRSLQLQEQAAQLPPDQWFSNQLRAVRGN